MSIEMENDDITFESSYEFAIIDQNDGSTVRGPVGESNRKDLFEGLNIARTVKGDALWFYSSDVEDQKFPMACRRRLVHTYRGSWS